MSDAREIRRVLQAQRKVEALQPAVRSVMQDIEQRAEHGQEFDPLGYPNLLDEVFGLTKTAEAMAASGDNTGAAHTLSTVVFVLLCQIANELPTAPDELGGNL